MNPIRAVVALGLAVCVALWSGAAAADHMTGRYVGVEQAAGTFLDIAQTGTLVRGTFSGQSIGDLNALSDGANNLTGVIAFGPNKARFEAVWSPAGIAFSIIATDGDRTAVFFAAEGAQPPPAPPPPQPQPPPPPPAMADVAYFVIVGGQQVGPLALSDLVDRARTGALLPTDFVWKAGLPDWLPAATLPELATAFVPPPPPPPTPQPPPPPTPQPPPPPGPAAAADAAVTEALRAIIVAIVEGERREAPAEERAAVVECLMGAVGGLPIAERQMLVAEEFDPNAEQLARLELLQPGITDRVEDCFDLDVRAGETAVYEALRTLVTTLVAEAFPAVTPEVRDALSSCLLDAYGLLAEADVAIVVAANLFPPDEVRERIAAANPAFVSAVQRCDALTPADPGPPAPPAPPTTPVTTPAPTKPVQPPRG